MSSFRTSVRRYPSKVCPFHKCWMWMLGLGDRVLYPIPHRGSRGAVSTKIPGKVSIKICFKYGFCWNIDLIPLQMISLQYCFQIFVKILDFFHDELSLGVQFVSLLFYVSDKDCFLVHHVLFTAAVLYTIQNKWHRMKVGEGQVFSVKKW